MAGGDLDGDTFHISWDERLIPHPYEPLIDKPIVPKKVARVTDDMVKDFFVDCIYCVYIYGNIESQFQFT